MKRLMIIALIFACHVAAFALLYFGRVRSVAICGSDFVLFAIPFGLAATAYAVVFANVIKVQNVWARRLLIAFASLGTGAMSAGIGMVVAFSWWGT